MKGIVIAIVGAGQEGYSLYCCFKRRLNIRIAGIADVTDEGLCLDEPENDGVLISKSLEEIVTLENLNIIIDTTNDPEISKEVHRLKKHHVQVIESSSLELIVTLKDKRNSVEAKLQSLLSNVNDGIQIVDKDGVITYINNSFLKMTGLSSGELLGKNVFDHNDSPLAKALKLKKAISGRHQFPDRLKGECNFTATPIIVGDKFIGVIGIFKDLPEMLKLMEELQRSSAIIEELYDKISQVNGLSDIDDTEVVPLDRMEQVLLRQALSKYGYTVEGKKLAARALNISLATLYNKLKKYQIS